MVSNRLFSMKLWLPLLLLLALTTSAFANPNITVNLGGGKNFTLLMTNAYHIASNGSIVIDDGLPSGGYLNFNFTTNFNYVLNQSNVSGKFRSGTSAIPKNLQVWDTRNQLVTGPNYQLHNYQICIADNSTNTTNCTNYTETITNGTVTSTQPVSDWYGLSSGLTISTGQTYQMRLPYNRANPFETVDLIPNVAGTNFTQWAIYPGALYFQTITINSSVATTQGNLTYAIKVNTSNSTVWNTTTCQNYVITNSTDNSTAIASDIQPFNVTSCGNSSYNSTIFFNATLSARSTNSSYVLWLMPTSNTNATNPINVWRTANYTGVFFPGEATASPWIDHAGYANMSNNGTVGRLDNGSVYQYSLNFGNTTKFNLFNATVFPYLSGSTGTGGFTMIYNRQNNGFSEGYYNTIGTVAGGTMLSLTDQAGGGFDCFTGNDRAGSGIGNGVNSTRCDTGQTTGQNFSQNGSLIASSTWTAKNIGTTRYSIGGIGTDGPNASIERMWVYNKSENASTSAGIDYIQLIDNSTVNTNYTIGTLTSTAPVVNTIVVRPASPEVNQNIACQVNVTSLTDATFNITTNWFKNGVNQTALANTNTSYSSATVANVSTVLSGNLTEGDNWSCVIFPKDTNGQGPNGTSTNITVLNHALTITQNATQNTTVYPNGLLQWAIKATDLVNSTILFYYNLTKNGVVVRGPVTVSVANNTQYLINDSGNLSAGDKWALFVQADNSIYNTSINNTPNFTISNPVIFNTVVVSPSSPNLMTNIACQINGTNNGTSSTFNITYNWFKNGVNQTALAGTNTSYVNNTVANVSTVLAGNLSDLDKWSCVVWGADSNGMSLNGTSANVTVNDAQPVITQNQTYNTTLYPTMALNYTVKATDSDNNTIILHYNLTKNGAVAVGPVTVSVANNTAYVINMSGNLTVGDKWALFVQADDGLYNSSINNTPNTTVLDPITTFTYQAQEYSGQVDNMNISTVNATGATGNSCNLTYNGTLYSSPTNTVSVQNQTFNQSVTPPNVSAITPFDNNWVCNFTSQYENLTENRSFTTTVNPNGFFICNATYTANTINYSIYDQQSGSSINATLSGIYQISPTQFGNPISLVNETNNSVFVCIAPSIATIQAVASETANTSGYTTVTYTWPVLNYSNVSINRSIFMLATVNGTFYVFTVENQYLATVQGAQFTVYRFFSATNTWNIVGEGVTDSTGSIPFFLQPLTPYQVTINASGYNYLNISLVPAAQTNIVIILSTNTSANTTSINTIWKDTSYNLTPPLNFYNSSKNITFTVSSNTSNLTSSGIVITRNTNGTITVVLNTSSSNPAGATFTYQANPVGLYTINAWIQHNQTANFSIVPRSIYITNSTTGLDFIGNLLAAGGSGVFSTWTYYFIALLAAAGVGIFVSRFAFAAAPYAALIVLWIFTFIGWGLPPLLVGGGFPVYIAWVTTGATVVTIAALYTSAWGA